jgi:ketosteroid isomerase-like protein
MKTCPACQTQYSDDTLSFCLQDGTPLTFGFSGDTPTVVLGETETVVARSGSGARPGPSDPGQSAWQQSQVTHLASQPTGKKSSSVPIAVAATAIGMLLLVGIVGIAAFIYFNKGDRPTNSNVGNSNAKIPGGELNNGALPTPTISPLPTPTSTRPTVSPTPTDSPPPGDDSQTRNDVSQRVYDWKSSLESRDLSGYMGNYADTVDYFSRRNASVGTVRADKARAFALYSSMRVTVSNMSVSVSSSGEVATAAFDKEWTFSGRDTSSGKVRSQLEFRKINGRWLITSEKDLRVYYTR